MKKISHVIQEIVLHHPFLEEALHNGFLNLTAFSEYIQSYVVRETQKDTSVHAIKMGLSRLGKIKTVMPSIHSGFRNISTRTGLSLMTIVRSAKSIDLITNLMAEKRKGSSSFFTVIEGIHEIDIIFDTNDFKILEERIPLSSQILMLSGLGLITCELSDVEISTPGLFYSFTKQLAFHRINIIQVISTYHELGVIIAESDIKKGVSVLLD